MKARPILLPILAGLFIGTSYIPFPPWAILFGFSLLLVAWFDVFSQAPNDLPLRRKLIPIFFYGWLTQFIFNLIGFHWIAYTAIEFGHFQPWAGILILVAFAALAHLYYPLSAVISVLLIAFITRKRTIQASAVPAWFFVSLTASIFLVVEYLWPAIFPWHYGYTWLWADLPGAQAADLIGFEGLNAITLVANALIAIGCVHARRNRTIRSGVPWTVSAIALFLGTNLIGLNRGQRWREPDRAVNLVIVQGNIGNYEKLIAEYDKDFARPIIQKYIDLTSEAFRQHPEATVAVWPETAFADFLNPMFESQQSNTMLRNFLRSRPGGQSRSILTGGYSYSPERKQTYNGFFAVGPDGLNIGVPYHKSTLIPFGEKFPLSEYIPYMKWFFPNLGSFGAGSGPTVLDFPEFRLGPQVCLDSLNAELSAAAVRNGAEVLANVTNDSWFGRTFEPYQHLTMTLARAIENRRPLIRATNTGISTIILADGTRLAASPIGQEWYGAYQLKFKSKPDVVLYSKIAGFSPWIGLVFTLLFLVLLTARFVVQE